MKAELQNCENIVLVNIFPEPKAPLSSHKLYCILGYRKTESEVWCGITPVIMLTKGDLTFLSYVLCSQEFSLWWVGVQTYLNQGKEEGKVGKKGNYTTCLSLPFKEGTFLSLNPPASSHPVLSLRMMTENLTHCQK